MKLTSLSRMKLMTIAGATLAVAAISVMQFTTSKTSVVAAATASKPTVVASPTPAPSASPVLRATTTKSSAPRTTTRAATKSASTAKQSFILPGIRGYVDMHTHPMAHLGFGKKLLHGAPDIGSIVPKGTYGCDSPEFRATTRGEALSGCDGTHGGWGTKNTCGDTLRAAIINFGIDDKFEHITNNPLGDHKHYSGSPDFQNWPNQTSKLHQQMWWEWIRRARDGGLRVMVALSVNNQLLANVLNGESPKMDVASSNLQITEIKSFVGRHNDFMEIAKSAADLRRIVTAGKLAVILGMEIDDFGGFAAQGQPFQQFPKEFQQIQVKNEIKRVYDQGVRYVFPIHLTNNVFGGSAVYSNLFNFANKHNNGNYFDIQHATDPNIKFWLNSKGTATSLWNGILRTLIDTVAESPAPCINDVSCLPGGKVRCCSPAYGILQNAWGTDGNASAYLNILPGQMNKQGLTPLGEYALQEMMKKGMMIDLDHMGIKSMDKALALAENFKGGNPGYPVNLGHNGLREHDWPEKMGTERNVNAETIRRVIKLKGMFGVGTGDMTPNRFIAEYRKVMDAGESETGLYAALGVGTDVNGLELLPRATPGLISDMFYGTNNLTKMQSPDRTWDYTKEGVAHYGLMKEFMVDVKTQPNGQEVWNHLWQSAEHFARMWEQCEKLSDK